MTQLLLTILPLDIASTLSPGILALTIILLGSKKQAISRTVALLLGNIITAVIIAFAAIYLGRIDPAQAEPNILSILIDSILGIFFLVFAFKILLTKDKKIKLEGKEKHLNAIKWIFIGFIISITNFDAVLLNFAATKEVGSSSLEAINKLVLIIVNILFFVLPITFPLSLYLVFPKIADKVLTKLNHYVIKYGKYMLFLLFLLFGVFLLIRSFKEFLAL